MSNKLIVTEVIIILLLMILLFVLVIPKYVFLFGNEYKQNTDLLDLSNSNEIQIDDLYTKLSYFNNLNTVKFGNNTITKEEKDQLINKYPNITFDVVATYNIYNLSVREDAISLDLSSVKVDNSLISNLSLLPNLNEVDLNNQDLSIDEMYLLIKTYPNVFFKWKIKLLDKEIDSSITSLDLSNQNISNLSDFTKSIALLSKLTYLNMSNTNLSNEELSSLRKTYPNIKIVWIVKMGIWSLSTDTIAFSTLVSNFPYVRLTSKDIEVLKYCPDLQALDLGHQSITDITVIGELTNLRVLILADNKIADISSLSNLKHLHYLELFMNKITDLTPLASCTEMVDLNICFNYRLSDITPILKYSKLERLWLIRDNISASDYTLLASTYPDVKLVKTGSGSTDSGWRTDEKYYKMIDMFHKNYIDEVFTKYDN